MIDERGLRINNFVFDNGSPVQISGIDPEGWIYTRIASYEHRRIEPEPIPLTPEWIKKLGLLFNFGYEFAKVFNLYIEYSEPNCHVCLEQYSEGRDLLPHIKYVHQLQNLYFTLTGEELKLKDQ